MSQEWFFLDSAQVDALRAEVATWRGTPFAPYSKAKGLHGGIDCANYCEAIYVALGVIELIDAPRSEEDYHQVLHNNRLLDFIRGRASDPRSAGLAARFAEFPVIDHELTEPPMAGDLIIGRNDTRRAREQGENLWHLAIMIGPRKLTNCNSLGVREGTIEDPTYNRHFFAHFRPRLLPSDPQFP